ncbi:YhgE/Pip domain-containing protein [Virgibacillus phasianinus]|uniref:YhgE/Pip domain-containing protein n=1 Tax=Virgibacillus phasianinus TaxID=2017483 RepID=UPI00155FC464|nr:YhgE/Pip domain-containing protein [Virgibacillus phasianinus]
MKNIWRIFKTDSKNIGTNWVAAILIGGLILLPSLYAWFNIAASWNPYGQTDQIPVGVVNEDAGAMVRDKKIDVGKELVETLKDNDDMDWRFVNRDKAMDKVEYGDYYAVIVIPENFSKKLATVISDNPKKASVEYYVNEKINAIAPKITEKGASVIVDNISSNFVSTVNGVIFDMFNDLGLEIEKDLPDIKKFENYIFKMEKDLPRIKQLINESLTDASSAEEIINKAQGMVPKAKQTTNDGLAIINDTTAFLTEAENRLNEIAPKVKADLKKVQNMAESANDYITKIQSADIDFSAGDQLTDQVLQRVNGGIQTIETIEKALNQLKETNNANKSQGEEQQAQQQSDQQINQALQQLAALKAGLQEVKGNITEINSFIGEKKQQVDNRLAELQTKTANVNTKIDAFMKEYTESIEPTILAEVAKAKGTLANAKEMLSGIQETIPEVERILNRTEDNLGKGEDKLGYISSQFPYVNAKVNQLADRIREIQGETDINEIIELLQNDPDAEKSFFSEPVQLNQNKLFPIPNYGSGMTPFYTVLAIWVGALLLISLLATDVKSSELYSVRQVYYGRFLTFLSIGFLQTIIVSLGDIYLIEAYIKQPLWFILFGLLSCLVFMAIVYTLVSVFGDVGKAMAIVFLVLQIAGSGGTYPVVLLPEFFQTINPFLPFTYAIDLMREAVGGIVWERAIHDVTFLSLFGIGGLLIGTFLKASINKKTNVLMKKSKDSGLFH